MLVALLVVVDLLLYFYGDCIHDNNVHSLQYCICPLKVLICGLWLWVYLGSILFFFFSVCVSSILFGCRFIFI